MLACCLSFSYLIYIEENTSCHLEHRVRGTTGRAWLLLALSEGTLEFYFTSFIGHAAQRARHYRPGAFLRDQRRLRELVLGLAELMAAELSTALRPVSRRWQRRGIWRRRGISPADREKMSAYQGATVLWAVQ